MFNSFCFDFKCKLHTCRRGCDGNVFTLSVASDFDRPNNAKKSAIYFDHPENKTDFSLGFYNLDFFHQCLTQKSKTCTGVFHWKAFTSVPYVGILIVQSFQKTLTILIPIDRQTQFRHQLKGLILSSRSESKILHLLRRTCFKSFIWPWFWFLIVSRLIQSVQLFVKFFDIQPLSSRHS